MYIKSSHGTSYAYTVLYGDSISVKLEKNQKGKRKPSQCPFERNRLSPAGREREEQARCHRWDGPGGDTTRYKNPDGKATRCLNTPATELLDSEAKTSFRAVFSRRHEGPPMSGFPAGIPSCWYPSVRLGAAGLPRSQRAL